MKDLSNTAYNTSKHAMIDIETFSTSKNAAMPSISAVKFNPFTGETFAEFEMFIDIQSQIDMGFNIKADTVLWWMQQDETARKQITSNCGSKAKHIMEVLQEFAKWCKHHGITQVWGNGASFDLGILSTAYETCNLKCPWMPWYEYDVRTIVAMNREYKKNEVFVGVKHNGIDDSKHQIKYVHKCIASIRLVEETDQQ